MNHVIRFDTAMFDTTIEPENPFNPMYGTSVIRWLQTNGMPSLVVPDPEAEDWGWYAISTFEGQKYLIGASSVDEHGIEANPSREWVVQIERQRTLKEQLFGKGKMTDSDPCFLYVKSLIENEPEFTNVSIE